jgi:hypothetical protein
MFDTLPMPPSVTEKWKRESCGAAAAEMRVRSMNWYSAEKPQHCALY